MSTLPAETDLPTADERKTQIQAKLRLLYLSDLDSFFLLVRAARVPGCAIKRCTFPVERCVKEHPDCSDTAPFLGLVKSINDCRHDEIDPEVRDVILSSTSKAIIMPILVISD